MKRIGQGGNGGGAVFQKSSMFGSAGLAALLALTSPAPSHAIDVTTTSIVGWGAPLGSDGFGGGVTEYPLNNYGIVAINAIALTNYIGTGGFHLTDGSTYNFVGGNFGPGDQQNYAFTINDVHTLTYTRTTLLSAPPYRSSQFFDLSVPYSFPDDFSAASDPFGTTPYRVDTNSNGIGAALTSHNLPYVPAQLIRLNGDGTSTALDIDPSYLVSSYLAAPTVLESGDIYSGLLNYADQTYEIWRFESGQTSAHTVVYSIPVTEGAIYAWGVNENGELIVALADGHGQSWLQRIAVDGASQVVTGSLIGTETAPGHYSSALINSSGLISALRHIGGANPISELVYVEAGGPLSRALATGATINAGRIVSINSASEMNEFGQLTLFLQLADASPFSTVVPLVVRVDPPGSSKVNPVVPNVCAIGRGWCFDGPVMAFGAGPARPVYYDPEIASGYEYVATSNAFAGVEIPFSYGDGRFDLYLWDAATARYFDSGVDIITGEFFSFDQLGQTEGITRFALHGIEPEAAVDPANPRGFVTGLTFASTTARVRFSMTAIVPTTVQWPFQGFNSPIDNPPTVNIAKAGQGMPLKFSLGGNRGLDIFESGFPSSQAVNCGSLGTSSDVVEESSAAGASGVQYDSIADQYTYVWKTSSSWAGTCRLLNLKLKDGSQHAAYFQFKK